MTPDKRQQQFEEWAARYTKSLQDYQYIPDYPIWSRQVLNERITRYIHWHAVMSAAESKTGRNPYLTDDGPLFDWKDQ
jgi:primase-polymerase (primpol)-like protein